MKLTYSLLKAELEAAFGEALVGKETDQVSFDAVALWQPEDKIESHVCYITDSLPSGFTPGSGLFLICAPANEKALAVFTASAIVFTSTHDPITVLNAVSRTLSKYNRWEDAMENVLQCDGSMDELLRCSMPIINTTLVVIDSVFHVLAFLGRKDDQTFKEYGQFVSDEHMAPVRREFSTMRMKQGPMLRKLPGMDQAYCMNMHLGSFYLGAVCIVGTNRKLRDSDAYLLERLTSNVQNILLRQGKGQVNDPYSFSYLLSKLLKGSMVDRDTLIAMAESSGIRTGSPLLCMALRNSTSVASEYNEYFIKKVGITLPIFYIPAETEYSFALLDEGSAGIKHQNLNELLQTELLKSNLRAGLSERFHNIQELSMYAQQAIEALIAAEHSSENGLTSFSDCWVDYVLYACFKPERPIMLWPEGFRRLIQHDQESSRASYVETLRVYLFHNMNANAAAKSLGISRNAFTARLERMCSLLDMDLNDPKQHLRLLFSLFAREKEGIGRFPLEGCPRRILVRKPGNTSGPF